MATFLLILSSMSIPHGAATPLPVVAVVPQTLTVGEEGVPLPTDPFTVNITVANVVNMYCWQVIIYFDATILNCTGAEYPTDHVFAGKQFIPLSPTIEPDYIMFAATIYYEEDLFSGNGTLCQITFIGKAVGTSDLEFDPVDTCLLDYDLATIDGTTEQGNVTVIPEFPPSLTALLLIIATLTAAILSKTARSKNN